MSRLIAIILFFNLSVCQDIYMTVDLALKKVTQQSSTSAAKISSFAVDGKFNPTPALCSETLVESNPWWTVKFHKAFFVRTVRILSPSTKPQKLKNITVKTSFLENANPINDESFRTCNNFTVSINPSQSATIYCIQQYYARKVLISSTKEGPVKLNFCEVEIWSMRNIALNKQSSQTSSGWSGAATIANDGHTNALYYSNGLTCSHTHNHVYSWWKIDLSEQSNIFALTVVNRVGLTFRLKDIRVSVSDIDFTPTIYSQTECSIKETFNSYTTLRSKKDCTGRYLAMQMTKKHGSQNYLTLCEVSIYGTHFNSEITFVPVIVNETYTCNTVAIKKIDCNGNSFYSINLLDLSGNQITVDLMSVLIGNECAKSSLKLFAHCSLDHFVTGWQSNVVLNECELESVTDGYYTEFDMNDICSFKCRCNEGEAKYLSVFMMESFPLTTYKDIYLVIKL
ncbi:unnamed protein product [Dimorphilus gyrociliatus]|uniref:Fucolectin tachylectin-4 pentraxin-1 domain-containing protein n=1 Tax=Dimorphilus gyrociliatus TaxID=2664684 RepID=A0A7I8VJE8_9ANNE|nr:unnamed protein product [Dimorphilus gyrociliatus]